MGKLASPSHGAGTTGHTPGRPGKETLTHLTSNTKELTSKEYRPKYKD